MFPRVQRCCSRVPRAFLLVLIGVISGVSFYLYSHAVNDFASPLHVWKMSEVPLIEKSTNQTNRGLSTVDTATTTFQATRGTTASKLTTTTDAHTLTQSSSTTTTTTQPPTTTSLPTTQSPPATTSMTTQPPPPTPTPPTTTTQSPPTTTTTTSTTTASTTETTNNSVVIGCPFQNLDPFYPKEMKGVKKQTPLDCSKGLPVFVYIDDQNRLIVNFTKVKAKVGKLDYCEYTRAEITDENDSDLQKFKWSKKFLNDPLQLTDEDEHVFVQCFLKKKLVSQTFKGRVLKKPKVEARSEANYKRQAEKYSPVETMSVLIVGIDGMSKQNLIRTMPKTRNYILDKMHARELNMFNKVGDNTFPNILVFHSGESEEDILKNWTKKQYFDDIEEKFIWHHYQNAGYRTSMSFDVTWMTAYHYVKKGWKHPTFDYYTRPLRLAIEKDKPCRKAGGLCVGELPELIVLQDYIHQMTSLFNNTRTKPYFNYNFFTLLTHDEQQKARKGDDIYHDFFAQLDRNNVSNNTITIFFSDHGTRFTYFRGTFNGKIEINTPFVFFMFPPWFEKKYPEVMNTFETNQNRLTTFFDLNKTLKDLLKFDGKSRKGSLDTRAISLFDEIPIERTCKHADIPMEYCNCKTLSDEKVSDDLINAVSKVLTDAIVAKTKHHRNICALLALSSVKSVLTMTSEGKGTPYYQVTVTTEPGGGLYETVVQYDESSKTGSVVGEIIRLNLYKGQDGCVDTLKLKLYCFCKT